MIISCHGWIWAASFLVFGGKAGAQVDVNIAGGLPTTTTTTSNILGTSTSLSSSFSVSGTTSSISSASIPPPSQTIPTTQIVPPVPMTLAQASAVRSGDQMAVLAEWRLPDEIVFNKEATFSYRLAALIPLENFGLYLAQTKARDGEPLHAGNTKSVIQLLPCHDGECEATPFDSVSEEEFFAAKLNTVGWMFKHNTDLPPITKADSHNFFLCFGSAGPVMPSPGFTCHDYSKFFSIVPLQRGGLEDGDDDEDQVPTPQPPSTSLFITPGNAVVTYQGAPSSAIVTLPASGTRTTTITSGSSLLATPSSTSSPQAPEKSAPTGDKALSTGAIVGIALGSLVVVSLLAVLALFFCIRRRRRAQSGTTHEQAMLTRSHPEGSSQDALAEKDNAVRTLIHPNSNDSSFLFPDQNDTAARQTLIPIGAAYGGPGDHNDSEFRDTETREVHASPYEAPPPASSTTPVFVAASSPPRRKPTNASTTSTGAVSALSRNISSATTTSNDSYGDYPVHSQLHNIGEEGNSPTESQARYGETPRHFPQISDRGSNASPFLSEPGMSAEEIARLDDEERRIDAAIAAADEQRERDRSGSGIR